MDNNKGMIMQAQLSDNYRLIGRNLLKRKGRAFIQVRVVPTNIKSLSAAIAWHEALEEE